MWVRGGGDAINCYLQVSFTSSVAPLIGREKTDVYSGCLRASNVTPGAEGRRVTRSKLRGRWRPS